MNKWIYIIPTTDNETHYKKIDADCAVKYLVTPDNTCISRVRRKYGYDGYFKDIVDNCPFLFSFNEARWRKVSKKEANDYLKEIWNGLIRK